MCCLLFPLLALWGCSTPNTFPVQYIPPVEFFLGPEDVLEVTVWKNADLSGEVIIRPDGYISMPLVGDVLAADLTADKLADRIAYRLNEFMTTPNVSVQVKEVNSYFFYVLGEVTRPGKYQVKSYATVLQGVSLAGGFTPFASKNQIQVIRPNKDGIGKEQQIRIPLKYDNVVSGKGPLGDFILHPGDTIVVP
ncbi:MAG TPA: polysaccharide biosynthesis/export family protein [Nitrospiria bacterium]